MSEDLSKALEPSIINVSPGPEYGDDRRHFALATGIEVAPEGKLWCAWFSGGDSEKGIFLAVTSDDNGTTWSAPALVIDPNHVGTTYARRTLVGNLWTDPLGRLWVFYDQSIGYFDGRAGVWAIVSENPDARKPTWSNPERIWHGATLNKPTVLSSGEWMLPVSLWDRGKIWEGDEKIPGAPFEKDLFKDLDIYRMANVLISSDEGKTWERRGGVRFPKPDFDEHMIVEKKDGQLWMLARTGKGIWESFSCDQGKNWSDPSPSKIISDNTRFFIRRLASGNLLLVKNGRTVALDEGRHHLTAFISKDDGETWEGGLSLDTRGSSYPDGAQGKDGMIYVTYDFSRSGEAEILMARFTEDDVLAREFKSPESRARVLVNKATGPKPKKTVKPPSQVGIGGGDKSN